MPVLVLSEGGMDVSRDPFGELQGAVAILVQQAMKSQGISLSADAIELGFWSRFPQDEKVRGNDKRLAKTIEALSKARPDVDAIVVVIDADGDGKQRLKKLHDGRSAAEAAGAVLALKTAVGVAVEMVEAWLIADHNSVVRLLKRDEGGKHPESHSDPKSVLRAWIDQADLEVAEAYRLLAESCKLELASDRAPSLKRFLTDIGDRCCSK